MPNHTEISEDEPFSIRAHLVAHFGQVELRVNLPRQFGSNVVLRLAPPEGPHSYQRLLLDGYGPDGRDCVLAFLSALRVGSQCSAYVAGWEYPDGNTRAGDEREAFSWAHMSAYLYESDLEFVDAHLDNIREYILAEKYSRTANALRLFEAALTIEHSSDLALLGFVGAIESLFSVAKQELSFRLSLSLSRFLAVGSVNQRFLFDRIRELYVVRSKIAHGDKVEADEETAAIVLAQHWTPQAAHLARMSLRTVFERQLMSTFDSKKAHERLMDLLPFADSLDQALSLDFIRAEPTIGGGVSNWLDPRQPTSRGASSTA